MNNSVSSINVQEIDKDSLEILNSTILKKVRTMSGPKRHQAHRNKITARYLQKFEPLILKQLIGCIITFGVRDKAVLIGHRYDIDKEFEDLFADVRKSWGLPYNAYLTLSLAYEQEITHPALGELGDIEKIPLWIPISEFSQMAGLFPDRKTFKKVIQKYERFRVDS